MASAKSPAMLTYLDGRDNKVRRKSDDKPNENYARELMELHTLGVHGGYTQDDVSGAAHRVSGQAVCGGKLALGRQAMALAPFAPLDLLRQVRRESLRRAKSANPCHLNHS